MARRTKARRGNGAGTGRMPAVEGLEARALMAVVYSQFPLASTFSTPAQITPGPDGNLWFTEREAVYFPALGVAKLVGAIGVINPTTHTIAEYPDGNTASTPTGITTGPDGNLWFADPGLASIGTINVTTHAITEYAVGRAGSTPSGITAGPDGNLWFTDTALSAIGMINPTTHAIVEYATNVPNSAPGGIVSGPGGLLWFTENQGIGRIDPTTHAMVDDPMSGQINPAITVGPDQNLWFTGTTNIGGGRTSGFFGEVVATTKVISGYLTTSIAPAIAVGPDGNLWSGLSEINPTTHAITVNPIVPSDASLNPANILGMAKGADNALYYTQAAGGSANAAAIVRLHPVGPTEAVISSNVYSDPQSNGTYAGGPLAGLTVYLDLRNDGTLDPGDPTSVTDANGYYTFSGLTAGSYTLRVVGHPGDVVVDPAGGGTVVATAGGQVANPPTIGIVPTSAVLTIAPSLSPFGSHNPDLATAEVNGLYRTILGHAPDPTGGAAAVAYLKGGGSLATLASGLFYSAEYDTIVVKADYRNYLHRSGSAQDVAAGVAALQGGMTEEALAAFFVSTPEYSLLHASNSDFATAAYGDILGRTPSAADLASVTSALANGLSRQAFTSFLFGSQEALVRAVNGFYSTFLARQGDPTGVAYWVAGLQGGTTMVKEAISFASSSGFVAQANRTVG